MLVAASLRLPSWSSLPERSSLLRALWARFGDLTDPAGSRSFRFEGMDFLGLSFVRDAAGLWSPPA